MFRQGEKLQIRNVRSGPQMPLPRFNRVPENHHGAIDRTLLCTDPDQAKSARLKTRFFVELPRNRLLRSFPKLYKTAWQSPLAPARIYPALAQ